MKGILPLLSKELKLEFRKQSTLAGIALYLFSLTFICYLTFKLKQQSIQPVTWSALFWLVILFAVMNSVAKSFIGERKGLSIYYYYIASPQAIIISKIIYNAVLAFALSAIAYFLFVVFIGNPVQDVFLFFLTLVLTSWGLASSLSFISAIAAKASNSHVVMAVLSFPVLIAVLLMAIRLSKNALDGLDFSVSADELYNLLAINCISTALAYVLFPYIWRS
jgi:heme exporter protein B